MKKVLALLWICAVSVGLNAANLTKSGKGYGNVEWGANVETFKAKYPGAKEVEWYSDKIKLFSVEEKKDKSVFYFYQNKLTFVNGQDGKEKGLFCSSNLSRGQGCGTQFHNLILAEEKTERAMMPINIIKAGKSPWGLSVEQVKGIYGDVQRIKLDYGNSRIVDSDFAEMELSDIRRDLGIRRFKAIVGLQLGNNSHQRTAVDVFFNFYQNKLYRMDFKRTSIFDDEIALKGLPSNSEIFKYYETTMTLLEETYAIGRKENVSARFSARFYVFVNPTTEKQLYAKKGLTLPVYGYDKVEWGADIQTVMNNYSDLKEISDADSSFGKRVFVQLSVSESMVRRSFTFYRNRLYKVSLLYKDTDENLLTEKFNLTFGGGGTGAGYVRFVQRNQINPETFAKFMGASMDNQYLEEQRQHKKKYGQFITREDQAVGLNAEMNYLGAIMELAATAKLFAEAIYGSPEIEKEVEKQINLEKNNIKKKQAEDARKKHLEYLDR